MRLVVIAMMFWGFEKGGKLEWRVVDLFEHDRRSCARGERVLMGGGILGFMDVVGGRGKVSQ